MPSAPAAWIVLAAAGSVAAAWLRYRVREEGVRGRTGPATLHAAALFLVLAGLVLPPLRGSPRPRPPAVVLLDLSASMELPVRPGGIARIDSALRVLSGLSPDRVLGFGDTVLDLGAAPDSAGGRVTTTAHRTRVAPALRAARTAGAASVTIVTDGEIEDREEARRESLRLGLAVAEVRVAEAVLRTTVRGIDGPGRAVAGDTLRFEVEIATSGPDGDAGVAEAPDSLRLLLSGSGGQSREVRVERPAPGRSGRVAVRLPAGGAGWEAFTAALESGADPLGAPVARRTWVEVLPAPRGAVLVSTEPDREAALLLPVLARSGVGSARAFVRVSGERWVSAGSRPAPVEEDIVRRAVATAELLVLQGDPSRLPAWLLADAARARRLLFLPRGAGPVPGTDARVGAVLPGEWYPSFPPPASPVAGYLPGGPGTRDLPPVAALRALTGLHGWNALELMRDRRGEPRAAAVGSRSGATRRVVVAAEGTWRWAARTGSPREVYRGLFGGLVAWLTERAASEPVDLATPGATAGDPLRLRVSPEVEALEVRVRDADGSEIARESLLVAGPVVRGPRVPEGDLTLVASGRMRGGETFRRERPLHGAGAESERAGRRTGPALTLAGAGRAGEEGRRRDRPVWPFALAAGLFCVEWIWRRRIGLR